MIKRIRSGDIFEVKLKNGEKRFVQFIYIDRYNLGTDLIRCLNYFDYKVALSQDSVNQLISQNFLFYAYTSIKAGLGRKVFNFITNVQIESDFESPIFRSCGDIGPNVGKSYNWYIIKNSTTKKIGELTEEYKNLPTTHIMSPENIVKILENGYKDFNLPY